MSERCRKRFTVLICAVFGAYFFGSCGGGGGGTTGTFNANFADLSPEPVPVTTEISPDDTEQVVTIEAGAGDQNGMIGEIEEQTPSQVLCVIIDPREGDNAELEVCEADKANTSSDSVNGICPEADQVTRCASFNEGSVPDYCVVTGDADYIFIVMNLTSNDIQVAYQVIDVTDLPNQSCDDLNITEDSIQTDDSDL